MNNVIILEGPDNIGKTALVHLIKNKYYNAIVVHHGPNKTRKEGKQVFLDMIDTLSKCNNKIFIFDRSPWGEFVYGKLFRNYNPYTYWKEIVRKVNDLDTRFMFISLFADEYTYRKFEIPIKGDEKKRYQKTQYAERISLEFINLLNKCKDFIMTRLIINCNNYDTLDNRNKYILSNINSFISQKSYRISNVTDYSSTIFNDEQLIIDFDIGSFFSIKPKCNVWNKCKLGEQHRNSIFGKQYKRPTTGVGNVTDPKYIFVGEAPGHLGCGTYGIPFYGDRSGYLFYDALCELNILPSEYYLTNTIKCCPINNNLGEFYSVEERLNLECVKSIDVEILPLCKSDTKIIALGRVASNTLNKFKVPHTMIYHPAYYLRIGKSNKFKVELEKVCK